MTERFVYVKVPIETFLGVGVAYFELERDSGWATRQVCWVNDRYYSSRERFHAGIGLGLADVPFTAEDIARSTTITAGEFEIEWKRSAE